MRVCIGIPVNNEEKNIGVLLDFLLSSTLLDIFVVSSSTDGTDRIIESYGSRIRLIKQEKRKGKTSALNELLKVFFRGYDYMIYMGGDNLLRKDSIEELLNQIDDSSIGIITGRPMPVDSIHSFLGWYTYLQWNLHHLISLEKPKASGELMAFRLGEVLEVPPAIINDDSYLQMILEEKGFKTLYEPKAIAYLKGCSTFKDMIKQRKRIYVGHNQILMLTGRKPYSVYFRSVKLLKKALPSWGFKEFFYLMFALFIQSGLYGLSKLDLISGKLPYNWSMVESTKEVEAYVEAAS